jgi:cell division protein FtsW
MSMDASRPIPMSVRERRLATLQRTGIAKQRKIALQAANSTFYGIMIVVSTLTLLGLIMVLSSSSVSMFMGGESAWKLFQRQAVFAGFGVAFLVFSYGRPYFEIRRHVSLILIGAVLLNLLPLIPGVGLEVNGARAWVNVGFLSFQPSEFLKLAVILFCADLISKRHRYVAVPRRTLWPMLSVMGVAVLLCFAQEDMGAAVIFAGIVLTMCFVAAMPLRYIFGVGAMFAFVGVLVLAVRDNARQRWMAFLDIESTKSHTGYQVYQSLLSIANGGPTGVGVGTGTSKWGYLPLSYSDFIFAVIAEELGLVGALAVIGGFALLAFFGIQVAIGARDMFGTLLASGITAWFSIQAIVNIGGVVGSLPLTGLTLPFLSYGGSSLMTSLVAAGLLLNVARNMK